VFARASAGANEMGVHSAAIGTDVVVRGFDFHGADAGGADAGVGEKVAKKAVGAVVRMDGSNAGGHPIRQVLCLRLCLLFLPVLCPHHLHSLRAPTMRDSNAAPLPFPTTDGSNAAPAHPSQHPTMDGSNGGPNPLPSTTDEAGAALARDVMDAGDDCDYAAHDHVYGVHDHASGRAHAPVLGHSHSYAAIPTTLQ